VHVSFNTRTRVFLQHNPNHILFDTMHRNGTFCFTQPSPLVSRVQTCSVEDVSDFPNDAPQRLDTTWGVC
jgi:hypothetical protein